MGLSTYFSTFPLFCLQVHKGYRFGKFQVIIVGKHYMYLRTASPNAMPMKVAIAMPKMPARIPGTIIEFHSLAVAIPQAVVGPPTLAFDAISNNFRSNPNSFPNPRITARWTAIWIRAKKKILGAVLMTLHMFPLAPTTAKNTCISQTVANKKSLMTDKRNWK